MSPTHTVSCNASIRLGVGDRVFTNHRNPIFTIMRDDVGKHDIVVPCCDPERYARDFDDPHHRHCLRNLEQARDLLNVKFDVHGEQAWNVFMHNRVTAEGAVVTDPAAHGRRIDHHLARGNGRCGVALGLPAGFDPVQCVQPNGDEAGGARGLSTQKY